jgi:lysophospholipase L1-like esterase
MILRKVRLTLTFVCILFCSLLAQAQDSILPTGLGIDSSYAFMQFYDQETGKRFHDHFRNSGSDKVVIFHYGGSHIQAERPTTFARASLQRDFGNGGRGMIFNYGAANTYSSVNYSSTAKGNWVYAKSFQIPPKIPLGVCGMSVETSELNAELNFHFKAEIPDERYKIILFIENDSTTLDFDLKIDTTVYHFNRAKLKEISSHAIEIIYTGKINEIQLKTIARTGTPNYLRFYGIDIEHEKNTGVVYHSLGVGAAAMRSVLYLDKMPEQAEVLNPDFVILDFGTNDILYTNSIDPKLPDQIRRAIRNFRKVNPEVIIILTSVQDLYRKGKYITAGPVFRDLIDSIAREQKCMFWNWYDLSGGLRTIRNWHSLGYAQSDCIHLTQAGYKIKGDFLYRSFLNTYIKLDENPELTDLRIPMRKYDLGTVTTTLVKDTTHNEEVMTGGAIEQAPSGQIKDSSAVVTPKPKPLTPAPVVKKTVSKVRTYKVRSGDTLSQIAEKYHTSVIKIKKANGLKSDMIRAGQILKIP